jgi:hypothetical protein
MNAGAGAVYEAKSDLIIHFIGQILTANAKNKG